MGFRRAEADAYQEGSGCMKMENPKMATTDVTLRVTYSNRVSRASTAHHSERGIESRNILRCGY
jgi:hypothetical protein